MDDNIPTPEKLEDETYEAPKMKKPVKAAKAAAARADAIAHAKSLGFTAAMIAVMYPNLVEA